MLDQISHRICVAVGGPDMVSAIKMAKESAEHADVIEIRLDCIAGATIQPFIETIACPLLFTNRPTWEGGSCNGPECARIDLLLDAARGGAAYIDLELQSPAESLQNTRNAIADLKTQLILSHHNFERTPPRQDLLKYMVQMQEKGADVGKLITMAHDYHDVLRVLQLQADASDMNFPLIAFCMGRAGVISRFATLELGGYMTYCAADAGQATAPGQVMLSELRSFSNLLESNCKTSIVC